MKERKKKTINSRFKCGFRPGLLYLSWQPGRIQFQGISTEILTAKGHGIKISSDICLYIYILSRQL